MTLVFRAVTLAALALIVFLTLGPVSIRSLSPLPPDLDRPLAFFATGLLLMLSWPRHRMAVFLVLVMLVIGLEFAQNFRPGRHGRALDAVEKIAGGAFGFGVGMLLATPRRRGKQHAEGGAGPGDRPHGRS